MANNTTVSIAIPNNVLLCSVVFKFIAIIIGVLGNVTVIIYTIFSNKEKTATSYLVGNLALTDLLVCLTYPIWMTEYVQIMLNIKNDRDLFCKFSRATPWAFMSASVATLLAITVDRYLYIVKPLRYPQIVTHRRVFLAVLAIWITTCCLFIVLYIHFRSHGIEFRSLCYIPDSTSYFTEAFGVYIPLTLIFFLNFHVLSVARKQRKRIFTETTIASADNSTEESTNRMRFVLRFFVGLKEAKTFATVVAVLTICILTPTVVGQILNHFCTRPSRQIWYAVFHYELYGINSVVNAFIYGMRHVKYRKAYLHILFKLFPCHKATRWEVQCWFLYNQQHSSSCYCVHNFPQLHGKNTRNQNWEGRATTVYTTLNVFLHHFILVLKGKNIMLDFSSFNFPGSINKTIAALTKHVWHSCSFGWPGVIVLIVLALVV